MFDLFKIGFLTISFADVLDIIIVTFIIYGLFKVIRGTIAAQIFIGLIVVVLASILAQALTLKALSFLLRLITDIWVIAFIVLFQPEIRRLLVLLGRNPFFRLFVKNETKNVADILTEASFEMAQFQHGALIVIAKSTGLGGVIETGEVLNARITKNLIRSIFFPRSPLHDGAVVISNNIVEAAKCTLPLTSETTYDGMGLGMRHRAGLGITEQADVLVIIVSEETGSISIAENGKLTKGLSKESLKSNLTSRMNISKEKGIKGVFDQFIKNKEDE